MWISCQVLVAQDDDCGPSRRLPQDRKVVHYRPHRYFLLFGIGARRPTGSLIHIDVERLEPCHVLDDGFERLSPAMGVVFGVG